MIVKDMIVPEYILSAIASEIGKEGFEVIQSTRNKVMFGLYGFKVWVQPIALPWDGSLHYHHTGISVLR